MSSTKPSITLSPNGPYMVKDLQTLQNSKGGQLLTKAMISSAGAASGSIQGSCSS